MVLLTPSLPAPASHHPLDGEPSGEAPAGSVSVRLPGFTSRGRPLVLMHSQGAGGLGQMQTGQAQCAAQPGRGLSCSPRGSPVRGKQVAAPTELIGTLNPSLSFLRSSEQSRGTTFPGWFLVLLSKLQFMEPLSVIVSYASQLSDAGGGGGEK